MPFIFQAGWDSAANNNGASEAQIQAICANPAIIHANGDAGLRAALQANQDSVSVVKGIHQENNLKFPHLTVDYLGGRWHVDLVTTAVGGVAGYRVSNVSQ